MHTDIRVVIWISHMCSTEENLQNSTLLQHVGDEAISLSFNIFTLYPYLLQITCEMRMCLIQHMC